MRFSRWIRPSLPIDLVMKWWVEARLAWLVETFGRKPLLNAQVVLPVEMLDGFESKAIDATVVVRRICKVMGVEYDDIEFKLGPKFDPQYRNAVGLYIESELRPTIWIDEDLLNSSLQFASTVAHELAHHLLLAPKHLTHEDEDHEYVTDLLVVFHGLGLLIANTALEERMSYPFKWGYLSAGEMGYAMAVCAWVRGDLSPPWTNQLRLDARSTFRKGLKYLQATSDCLLTPSESRPSRQSVDQLLREFESASATHRLAALSDLGDHPDAWEQSEAPIVSALRHPDAVFRAEAARVIDRLGTAARSACDDVVALLRDADPSARANAAIALARLEADSFLSNIAKLFEDGSAFGMFENRATPFLPQLMDLLRASLFFSQPTTSALILSAIERITPTPRLAVERFFAHADADVLALALLTVDEFNKSNDPAPSNAGDSDDSSPESPLTADEHFEYGLMLMAKSDWRAASRSLSQAIELAPEDVECLHNRAMCYGLRAGDRLTD